MLFGEAKDCKQLQSPVIREEQRNLFPPICYYCLCRSKLIILQGAARLLDIQEKKKLELSYAIIVQLPFVRILVSVAFNFPLLAATLLKKHIQKRIDTKTPTNSGVIYCISRLTNGRIPRFNRADYRRGFFAFELGLSLYAGYDRPGQSGENMVRKGTVPQSAPSHQRSHCWRAVPSFPTGLPPTLSSLVSRPHPLPSSFAFAGDSDKHA